MPTLGEFIERATRHYGFERHSISAPGLGEIKYLYRERPAGQVQIVDLRHSPENRRLTRTDLDDLCAASGIPVEDFIDD